MLELVKQRESERAGSNGGLSVERTGGCCGIELAEKNRKTTIQDRDPCPADP